MKKKILSFLLTFCLVVTVIPLMTMEANAATAYTEKEANNQSGTANTISVATGNTLSGTITYKSYDADWFKFTLSKGSTVQIKFQGTKGNENVLNYYLYSQKNTSSGCYTYQKVEYNSSAGAIYNNRTYHLSAGTYLIKIGVSYPCSADNTYKLSFTTKSYETAKEPNDYIKNAKSLSSGKTYKAFLADLPSEDFSTFRDVDYYKYKTKKAGDYYMTLKNVNGTYGISVVAYNKDKAEKKVFKYTYSKYSNIYVQKEARATYQVKLPKGTTYFEVKGGVGKYTISLTAKPGKVTGVKATKKGSKAIKVKWKAKKGVTGYKVYRSTKKKSGYKLIKTIKGASKKTYVDKNKKKGKRYYYKVVSYKKVNGYNCKGYASKIVSVKR